ncbi:hypothetical protein U1Q18_008405 [Sarracenia purpurea var. burkii]
MWLLSYITTASTVNLLAAALYYERRALMEVVTMDCNASTIVAELHFAPLEANGWREESTDQTGKGQRCTAQSSKEP